MISLCSVECELEKKRKDYAFQCQFNEKPSIIPGCPGEECESHNQVQLDICAFAEQWHADQKRLKANWQKG